MALGLILRLIRDLADTRRITGYSKRTDLAEVQCKGGSPLSSHLSWGYKGFLCKGLLGGIRGFSIAVIRFFPRI
jgi:hypothetical protein